MQFQSLRRGLVGLGLMVAVLAAGSGFAQVGPANSADWAAAEAFFDHLTGDWQGQGSVVVAPGTGEQEVKRLESRLSFSRPWLGEKRWTWSEELYQTDDRSSFHEEQAFFILLNGLYLGGSAPTDAAELVRVSQGELVYHFSWRNPPNREYRKEVTLARSGGEFTLREKLFLRGDLIEEKSLTYR